MGFGRIGRNLFRILYNSDEFRLAAISDVADHRSLEYLLRFHTIMGRFLRCCRAATRATCRGASWVSTS
jgi:glyceraldehyde-3-phosphate dehydrogenase/erythrose-4-phosphate dehydrogenase